MMKTNNEDIEKLLNKEMEEVDTLFKAVHSIFTRVSGSRSEGGARFLNEQVANLANLKTLKLGIISKLIDLSKKDFSENEKLKGDSSTGLSPQDINSIAESFILKANKPSEPISQTLKGNRKIKSEDEENEETEKNLDEIASKIPKSLGTVTLDVVEPKLTHILVITKDDPSSENEDIKVLDTSTKKLYDPNSQDFLEFNQDLVSYDSEQKMFYYNGKPIPFLYIEQ